jgi:hypothetical protein
MLSGLLRQIFGKPGKTAPAAAAATPQAGLLEQARALLAERRLDEAAVVLERLLDTEPRFCDASGGSPRRSTCSSMR